jgi:hypothetical protein
MLCRSARVAGGEPPEPTLAELYTEVAGIAPKRLEFATA